jgi:hypothetical protein
MNWKVCVFPVLFFSLSIENLTNSDTICVEYNVVEGPIFPTIWNVKNIWNKWKLISYWEMIREMTFYYFLWVNGKKRVFCTHFYDNFRIEVHWRLSGWWGIWKFNKIDIVVGSLFLGWGMVLMGCFLEWCGEGNIGFFLSNFFC